MQTRTAQINYALATVLVLVLTVLFDYVYLSEDELDKNHEHREVKTLHQSASKISQAAASSEKFAFVDIRFPEPIEMQMKKSVVDAPVPDQEPIKLPQEQVHTPQQQTVSAQMISSKVAEFASLDGASRVLYFPNENSQLKSNKNVSSSFIYGQNTNSNILAFMHQCIGLGLAALDGESLVLLNKPKHSSPEAFMQQYSQLMRVVSGTMLHREQNLRTLYAPNKPLVRLFPLWFDHKLAYQLAKYLVDTRLTQFSAQYKLVDDNLWLTNIKINGSSAQQDWLIKQGC